MSNLFLDYAKKKYGFDGVMRLFIMLAVATACLYWALQPGPLGVLFVASALFWITCALCFMSIHEENFCDAVFKLPPKCILISLAVTSIASEPDFSHLNLETILSQKLSVLYLALAYKAFSLTFLALLVVFGALNFLKSSYGKELAWYIKSRKQLASLSYITVALLLVSFLFYMGQINL